MLLYLLLAAVNIYQPKVCHGKATNPRQRERCYQEAQEALKNINNKMDYQDINIATLSESGIPQNISSQCKENQFSQFLYRVETRDSNENSKEILLSLLKFQNAFKYLLRTVRLGLKYKNEPIRRDVNQMVSFLLVINDRTEKALKGMNCSIIQKGEATKDDDVFQNNFETFKKKCKTYTGRIFVCIMNAHINYVVRTFKNYIDDENRLDN